MTIESNTFDFNEKLPLVSIITVVYNGERHLEQTINSVIEQDYQCIEYIIIDGGSTDGTHDIINQYKDQISVFISEPDKGLYDAMNKGINLAQGELIGMVNSDDWYEKNAVDLMVDVYLKNPLKTVFHGDRFDILPDGSKKLKAFNPSIFKFKYYGMTYNHPSMFVVKSEYRKHKYNVNLRVYSDYQFVLEAFYDSPEKFCYIQKPIVNYRLDGISGNMSKRNMLTEGFKARKEAGMSFIGNIFSIFVRVIVFFINEVKFKKI